MQFRPFLEPVPYEGNTDTIKIDEMERKTESFLYSTEYSFQEYIRKQKIVFSELSSAQKNSILNTFLESEFPEADQDMKIGIKKQLLLRLNK